MEWLKQAKCLDENPELFFSNRDDEIIQAKAVCMRCPVRVECLELALDTKERYGIWGGTTPQERKTIL